MFMCFFSCGSVRVVPFLWLCLPLLVWLCLCGSAHVALLMWLCLCGSASVAVCVALLVWLCVALLVWLCLCGSARVALFVWLCSCDSVRKVPNPALHNFIPKSQRGRHRKGEQNSGTRKTARATPVIYSLGGV